MKIVLNAVSAKMGGAANYLKNLARELAALNLEDEFIFFVPEEEARAISSLSSTFQVIPTTVGNSSFVKRLWFDQVVLRQWLKHHKADLLFSTANFSMFHSPCRQVMLVQNVLHFSELYRTQILPHKPLLAKVNDSLRRWLMVQSIKWADVVVTPSQAMLNDVRRYVRVPDTKVVVNHYGTNVRFSRTSVERQANGEQREKRLFFSALYADHKNVRTLLQALSRLQQDGLLFRLITSADPNSEVARGTSTWKEDAALLEDEGLKQCVEFTGILTSEQIASLYQSADLFVYPSLIEAFGFPVIEAMAAGVPIVAADAPINRELCQDAALYFEAFNPDDCAAKIKQALANEDLQHELVSKGLRRRKQFTWSAHLDRLLQIFRNKPLPDALTSSEFQSVR